MLRYTAAPAQLLVPFEHHDFGSCQPVCLTVGSLGMATTTNIRPNLSTKQKRHSVMPDSELSCGDHHPNCTSTSPVSANSSFSATPTKMKRPPGT